MTSKITIFIIMFNHRTILYSTDWGHLDGETEEIYEKHGQDRRWPGQESNRASLDSVDFSPQANYTDRATAARRWS
jgi:hypothetical protein